MTKPLLPLLLVSAVVLSGCGKKKEEPAPTPPAQQPAATSPGAVDQAKQVAADVAAQAKQAGQQIAEQGKELAAQTAEQAKAAAAQVTEQAKTAATQVKEQAKTAVADAKTEVKSLTDAFKKPAAPTGTDAPLDFAALTSKVSESAKSLLSDPAVTAPVKEQLTKLTDSVLGNQDGAAAAALNKIVALKPSDDQMGLVKELQSNLGVLALGRNFDANDPASGGAVKQTIAAIQAKDTASIVSGLQKIGATAKLTDSQKDIVGNLVGSYGGKLAGITDSVNKASDALKGFGF